MSNPDPYAGLTPDEIGDYLFCLSAHRSLYRQLQDTESKINDYEYKIRIEQQRLRLEEEES